MDYAQDDKRLKSAIRVASYAVITPLLMIVLIFLARVQFDDIKGGLESVQAQQKDVAVQVARIETRMDNDKATAQRMQDDVNTIRADVKSLDHRITVLEQRQ